MPANADVIMRALDEAEILGGLDASQRGEVRALAKAVQLQAGNRVFNLGEEATTLFLVASGSVSLLLPVTVRGSAREVTIEERGVGAVIAWSALVPPHKLTMSCVASSDVTLVGMDRAKMDDLFRRDRAVHLVVTSNLNKVIASRVAMLEALLIRDLQRWIAENYA